MTTGDRQLVKAIADLKVDTQVRGSPRIPDIPRLFAKMNKVHTINQTYTYGSISLVAATPLFGSVTVALGSTPLSSALATVFDTYRIEQATVRFIPLGTMPAGSGGFSPILTVLDYDDATPLTSVVQTQAYDNCQETPFAQYIERTFTPKCAIAVYNGSLFSGFGQSRSQWVDCSNPAIPHYGVKYATAGSLSAYANLYTIEIDAVISFKNVR
jgi:hypothetical protein